MVLTMDLSSGPKEIMIDDAGWGDLILGVVIGALELPAHRYMERRIPVAYFQSPSFEGKEYLAKTVDIIQEIITVMRADKNTRFKVCSGYILSAARHFLEERGYRVEKIEVTGELQQRVEHSFIRWCMEVGVPPSVLSPESGKNRFWALLEWVAENPYLREHLVKTGWKSWQRRWRKMVYEKEMEIRRRTLE
jgi:hypothetical protein